MSELIIKGIATETHFRAFERRFFKELKLFTENYSEGKEWLTTQEAMQYLRVKDTKFYSLKSKGIIKQYDLDGTKLYNRKELYEVVKNDS